VILQVAGTVQGICENKKLLCLCSFRWSCLLDVTGSSHNRTWDNTVACNRGDRKGPRKSLVRISDFPIEILRDAGVAAIGCDVC
jgi:hypothetical protein